MTNCFVKLFRLKMHSLFLDRLLDVVCRGLPTTVSTGNLSSIGLYRENAIAIESEANDSFGGNVYYVTMQITLPIP